MNPELQRYRRQFAVTRFVALALVILAPAAFAIATLFLHPTPQPAEGIRFVFYVLLVIALVSPFLYKIIERVQLSNYRHIQNKRMNPGQLFTSLTVIKLAFVEAIFVYGLLMFLLTGDRTYLWYFYPIGIAWGVVYWPTEGKFEAMIGKAKASNA